MSMPIRPLDMPIGTDGFTTRSNVYLDGPCLSQSAPIYDRGDEVANVLVCRIATDTFHVFVPTYIEPQKRVTPIKALAIMLHELATAPDECERLAPVWGDA